MKQLDRLIASVRNQLYANALLRCALLGAATWVASSALTSYLPVQLGTLVIAVLAGVFITKIYEPKKPQAFALIHQKVQGTEYSLALLDKENLNLAEQLQLERLYGQIEGQAPPRVWLAQLWPYGLLLLTAFLFRLAFPFFQIKSTPAVSEKYLASEQKSRKEKVLPPSLQTANVFVHPPSYSGLRASESVDLNVAALSGSRLTWRVKLANAAGISLRLSDGKSQGNIFQEKGDTGDTYEYRDKLLHSGIYNLKAYRDDSLVWQSEFYRLEAQPDLPPKITPASKELYRYHLLNDAKKISVSAKISDDFRVTNAFIVATLARGSGESVKFREVRLPLNPSTFKQANLTKILDLKALDFTPGDELYYYWAAMDNRQPEANFTKSDTYFIVYRDTTRMEESELATMAVNRMPEYFRSQRQIIIDTEKLIAKRKKINDKEFKSTSNEIGFDQKVLRLRYGQFMGEEFETNIGGGGLPDEHSDGASLEGFMHKHDTEEEHAAVVETPAHDHDHGSTSPAEQQDPLAALMEQYVHAHDDADINTFHEESTRSLLKMALEQMWQSELHLRLYEPEKALPFENKALEYLKTAQQKARSYVKKSGFDPPPLKIKELRLTGELDKINERYRHERTYEREQLVKKVGRILGYLELPKLSAAQQSDVQQVGTQLAETTINSGLKNWAVLGDLQKLASGKKLTSQEETRTKAFLLALIDPTWQTNSSPRSDPKLEAAFWRQLL